MTVVGTSYRASRRDAEEALSWRRAAETHATGRMRYDGRRTLPQTIYSWIGMGKVK